MSDRSTNEVGVAVDNLPEGIPFAGEIRAVLSRAYAEAREGEEYWEAVGESHLRTFLKTTPLGLAILDLARTVNEGKVISEHDRQVAERARDEGEKAGLLRADFEYGAIGYQHVRGNPYRAAKGEQKPLDPKPWLLISDQVFGDFRSDHDVSGAYWAFSPRPAYSQDREDYAS